MLSKIIINSYKLLIEIVLWLSLVAFVVGGWNIPTSYYDTAGFIGAIGGLIVWLIIAVIVFGAFLVLLDIR